MMTESERIAQVIQACMKCWRACHAGLSSAAPPRAVAWLQPLCRALIVHTAETHSGTELWTTAKWKTELSTWLPRELSKALPKQQWHAAVLRAVLGWHAAGCEHAPTARIEALRVALSTYQQEAPAIDSDAHLPRDPARSTSWQQVLHVDASSAAHGSALLDAGGSQHSKALAVKEQRVSERRATVALCRQVAHLEHQLKLAHAQAAMAGTAPIVHTPRTASPLQQPAAVASRNTQTPCVWQHALESSPFRVLQRTLTPGETIVSAGPSLVLAPVSPPRLRSPPRARACQPRKPASPAHHRSGSMVLSPLWSRRGVTPHVGQAATAASPDQWLHAKLQQRRSPVTPPRAYSPDVRAPKLRSSPSMSPAWETVLHDIEVASVASTARRTCSPGARPRRLKLHASPPTLPR